MTPSRPVGHEDRLSLVEHLDELRTRLIVCVAVFLVAFSVCYWQNDWLLDRRSTSRSTTHQHLESTKTTARIRSRRARASRSQSGKAAKATSAALVSLDSVLARPRDQPGLVAGRPRAPCAASSRQLRGRARAQAAAAAADADQPAADSR